MRNYRRKRDRPEWTQEDANAAVEAIRNGISIREASRRFSIPKTCLLRRLKPNIENVSGPVLGNYTPVFNEENEQLLVDHLLEMQRRFYGLTPLDVRRIAYELAERLEIEHPFNKTKKVAGEDWLHSFLKRNPRLSIRKPEATSLNRAVGFNKEQVTTFFDLLKTVFEKHNFTADNIYNYDETGISTVPKPTKILAEKGQKQVGRIVSGERGSNITVACAFSVTGNYIPPFYLFPRKRLAPSLLRDAPPGTVGFANGSGWMDSDHFLKYLDHFVEHSKPSKEKPVLLILDGHISHKQLEGVLKARENHIVMLTLPPHCSHRMQPLDLTFFGPFKAQYARECDFYMTSHKGEVITIYNVVNLSGKAFQKVATVDKAVKGFERSGIYPYNPDIFQETDFLPSTIHENDSSVNHEATTLCRASTSNVVSSNDPGPSLLNTFETPSSSRVNILQVVHITPPQQASTSSDPTPSSSNLDATASVFNTTPSTATSNESRPRTSNAATPSQSFADVLKIVSPVGAAESSKKEKRQGKKKEKSIILTSTPVKTELEQKRDNTKIAGVKRKTELEGEGTNLPSKKGKKLATVPKKTSRKKSKVTNRKKKSTSINESDKSSESESDEDDCLCLFCNSPYKNSKRGEGWIRCDSCHKWAHELCAGADDDDDCFICEFCK